MPCDLVLIAGLAEPNMHAGLEGMSKPIQLQTGLVPTLVLAIHYKPRQCSLAGRLRADATAQHCSQESAHRQVRLGDLVPQGRGAVRDARHDAPILPLIAVLCGARKLTISTTVQYVCRLDEAQLHAAYQQF